MANAERFVKVHKYFCNSCDCYFEEPEGPMKGHWFDTSGAYRDDDGDSFVPGTQKVLIGQPTWACHNSDGTCFLGEGDWTMIECAGYRCTSCGHEWMFDNDSCSAHDYGSDGSGNAKFMAEHCCTTGKNAPTNSGDLAAMAQPKTSAQKVTVIDF